MSILPIAIVIVLILVIFLILKLSKRLISFVISAVILVLMFSGAYSSYTQHITNPVDLIKYMVNNSGTYITNLKNKIDGKQTNNTKQNAVITDNDQQIAKQLMNYTSQQSAGPTNNYYWDAGPAVIRPTKLSPGDVQYSKDNNGRSSLAMGRLTYKMWKDSAGSRQGEPLNPPQGWPRNPKVAITYSLTNKTYHGYMYNRSHSIADSLAGEQSYTANTNFTTGTRPQNVGANQKGGMRIAEIIVENYWKANPNSPQYVDYQVLPIYNNDETLPRGTIIDIKSSDNQLNKRIVVINDVEEYVINYSNGTFTRK